MKLWILATGITSTFQVKAGSTWKGYRDLTTNYDTRWILDQGQTAMVIVDEYNARRLRDDPTVVVLGEET